MCARLRQRRWYASVLLTLAALFWLPAAALAQAQAQPGADLSELSLEELLGLTVVSSASKFPQEIREAPASITVLRADEIYRYGYRTLNDALRSVRGLYTTYDRNYSYLGMRGFARPGDYNTRFLLLLDGQRLNDFTYDMAPVGTDFPLDLTLIDRIEVIRGPASSLYGTNAFFAVINVVTRTSDRRGLQVDAGAGSLATRQGTVTYTQGLPRNGALLLSGSAFGAGGNRELYYPEFDTAGHPGIAREIDDDRSRSVYGSLSGGHFTVHGGISNRTKRVPTASYETVFNDGREETSDRRSFVNGGFEGLIGRGWLANARLAYDQYDYSGQYPGTDGEYPGAAPGAITLFGDGASTKTLTTELSLRKRVARLHQLTAGVEVRRMLESEQWDGEMSDPTTNIEASGTNIGAYLQDEARIKPWLLANVGLRIDHFPTFGNRVMPRLGLVWLPRRQTAVKLLHGGAFRAPNAYELNYDPEIGAELKPERIRSTEVVWEEFLTSAVRTSASFFSYAADDIIEQLRPDVVDELTTFGFANNGHLRGRGVELEVEARLANRFAARVSHTYARARDMGEERLSNSPEQLFKFGVQVPVSTWSVALEGQRVGTRLTLDGQPLDSFFLSNLTLTSPLNRRVAFSVGLYNLFGEHYSDPGAEEHRQQSIAQDGRTALARLRLAF